MSLPLTIYVRNTTPSVQQFFVFQQPATYAGGPASCTALYTEDVMSWETSGALLLFQIDPQSFACIQQASGEPVVGQPSGTAFATCAIDPTPPSGTASNTTSASLDPLALSPPISEPDIAPGAFRISMPAYDPPSVYNAGLAVAANGRTLLSNFVVADPNSVIDCTPTPQFFVQLGDAEPGTVIDFEQSVYNAARCDFSGGASLIQVTLNVDGTWAVSYNF